MKKIFTIMIAFFAMITFANAQTVQSSKLFENTYVTVYGGAISTTHANEAFFWDGFNNIVDGVRPIVGAEFGKYVTPVVGFSIEGLATLNTTHSNTIVDQSNVIGNLKLNLSNWFGGYKGQPRRVEVVFVPGLGWGHDYGTSFYDRNYLTYNVGAELNVNLGKARAWQINVKPVVMWNNYNNVLKFNKNNVQGRLQFGVTYKFGSKSKKSHNFVLCNYKYTAEEYDALAKRVAELESAEPVVKEVPVEKIVETVRIEKQEIPTYFGRTFITFSIGSSVLTTVERAKLAEFAKFVNEENVVYIVGSADTKTGSQNVNQRLAKRRAEVVKNALIKDFNIKPDRVVVETNFDEGESVETSRAAVLTLQVIDVD